MNNNKCCKNRENINIIFPIKVNLENESNLYSACSNPTNVVLVTVSGIIRGNGAWYSDRQS